MVVVTLSVCPNSLRGDLTLWLLEIDTGVYIGNLSARVREELWLRITANLGDGRATMVYRCNSEQGFDIKTYNTNYVPLDFDGMKLVLKPGAEERAVSLKNVTKQVKSKARRFSDAKKYASKIVDGTFKRYVILDLETSGLNPLKDQIIEIGALLVEDDKIVREYQALVKTTIQLPKKVKELTGLSDTKLTSEGVDLKEVLFSLKKFCSNLPIVAYNASFDYNFLRINCKKEGLDAFTNRFIDVISLVKKQKLEVKDHSLNSVMTAIGSFSVVKHRALQDCYVTHELYLWLLASKGQKN